jgi:hypothetical protein
MKQLTYISVVSVWLLFLFNGCATYPHMSSGVFEAQSDNARVTVAFSDHDRRLIHDYYRNKKLKRRGLPPGLAKKETLPPGLRKQLRKNGTLPPGLAKRNLPYELEERLSQVPGGYVRLRVGGDIILMNKTTEVIVDIIHAIE